jgi:putative flippase GtrA
MKTKLKQLLQRPGYRYILVGGSVYLLELIIIVAAQQLGAPATLAVAISFWIGLIVSFLLQKLVTFGDKRMHRKVVTAQVIVFCLLVLFNFGFTVALTSLLSNTIPAVVIRTLAIGCTTIWNFYLYKTRIFKSDESPVY